MWSGHTRDGAREVYPARIGRDAQETQIDTWCESIFGLSDVRLFSIHYHCRACDIFLHACLQTLCEMTDDTVAHEKQTTPLLSMRSWVCPVRVADNDSPSVPSSVTRHGHSDRWSEYPGPAELSYWSHVAECAGVAGAQEDPGHFENASSLPPTHRLFPSIPLSVRASPLSRRACLLVPGASNCIPGPLDSSKRCARPLLRVKMHGHSAKTTITRCYGRSWCPPAAVLIARRT
jgi:hypothetical protein